MADHRASIAPVAGPGAVIIDGGQHGGDHFPLGGVGGAGEHGAEPGSGERLPLDGIG